MDKHYYPLGIRIYVIKVREQINKSKFIHIIIFTELTSTNNIHTIKCNDNCINCIIRHQFNV